MGGGLPKGPEGADPGDLAADSPLRTFLGTWAHVECLNVSAGADLVPSFSGQNT